MLVHSSAQGLLGLSNVAFLAVLAHTQGELNPKSKSVLSSLQKGIRNII